MQRCNKKIGKRLVINSFLLSMMLSLCVGIIGFITYYVGVMEQYQDYLETAIKCTLKVADGDDIKQNILKSESSEKYKKLQESMNVFKDSSNLEYLYIIKPLHTGEIDNVKYIITAINDAEADSNDEIVTLGKLSGSQFSPKVVQDFFEYMEKDEISYYPNRTEFGYMYSAVAPIKDSAGKSVALAAAEISMDTVLTTMLGYIFIVVIFSIIVTAVFLLVQIRWMKNKIVTPITGLANAAEKYVRKSKKSSEETELVMQLPNINTKDELELLHNALQQMSLDIKEHMQKLTAVTAEKERIGAELDVAKDIQASMLPSIFPAFPEIPQVDIYASMLPAKEVGGDFYDFFLVDADHLVLVTADVSGKGVPAALFMVIAKTLLKSVAQTGISPKNVLEMVNKQLCVNNEANMFVTVWIGILEISTGKMICSNAGHEYPVIKRSSGDYELIKDKHGFVMAGFEKSQYTEYEIVLQLGDKIFLYTDGVPEATNASRELYGNQRMLDALNKSKEVGCKEILIKVKEDVDAFVGDAPQFDDITMLCLEYGPNSTGKKSFSWKGKPSNDAISLIRQGAEKTLEENNAPMKEATQIVIAIDEIVSNIVNHSNASEMIFEFEIKNSTAYLQITDDGKRYDPTKEPEPDITLSAQERKIGGLGIFMVKKTMDNLTYENKDDKNILSVTKSF